MLTVEQKGDLKEQYHFMGEGGEEWRMFQTQREHLCKGPVAGRRTRFDNWNNASVAEAQKIVVTLVCLINYAMDLVFIWGPMQSTEWFLADIGQKLLSLWVDSGKQPIIRILLWEFREEIIRFPTCSGTVMINRTENIPGTLVRKINKILWVGYGTLTNRKCQK